MFCEEHTTVSTGSIPYSYDGEDRVEETIDYYEKNIALEVQKQLGFALTRLKKSGVLIKRIDIVVGGDHGAGAFVLGAKVIVTFEDSTSHYFDVSVAEVTCRKDNAEILKRTIHDELTKGLEVMAKNQLHIDVHQNEKGDDVFTTTFGGSETEGSTRVKSISVILFVTGDLAWYACILGKESMSGHWCHLCKLSRTEYQDLAMEGEEWTTAAMLETAKEVEDSHDKKPKYGVKSKLWWDFIPIKNYVVPLLHTLIGIGNDLLDSLRDSVDNQIERISPAESRARSSLTTVEGTINDSVAKRDAFDASADGKKLKSLKAKIRVRKQALKKLGSLQEEQQDTQQQQPDEANIPIDDYLDDVDSFVTDADNGDEITAEEEDNDDTDDNTDNNAAATDEESNTAPPVDDANTAAVTQQIQCKRAELAQFTTEAKALQAKRDKITKRLNQARQYVSRLKEKLSAWRSEQKKKNGIESKMDKVLKE
eukprot:scaffold1837_cov120-Skeletonema_dohrnii-CCMP3373.AAC.1